MFYSLLLAGYWLLVATGSQHTVEAGRISQRLRFQDDVYLHERPKYNHDPMHSISYHSMESLPRFAKHDNPPPGFSEDAETSSDSRQYKPKMDFADSGSQLNEVCVAPDSRKGVCYDAGHCSERGGIPMGNCGQHNKGHVCCLFESTCGQLISEKHVYFRNPGYPMPVEAPQICRAKMNKIHSRICQLKLTFNTFDIGKPIEGNCTQDMFSVSGQNENNIIPRICGFNSGQHYYIAVDESGLVNLQMIFRGIFPRKFDIHIEQIECDSKSLAPPYCLQYFDSTQGTIKSFNYDTEDMNRDMSLSNEGYPNNIDYLICIRKETSFCSISYEFMSDPAGTLLPFSVGIGGVPGRRTQSSNLVLGAYSRTGQGHIYSTTIQTTDCDDDYLIVGGMRLCTKMVPNYIDNDLSSYPSAPDHLSNETETVKHDSNDTSHKENGELFEHIGEVSEVDELRRTHRRANFVASANQYYGGVEHRRMRPSASNRHPVNKRSSSTNLMATDWTPGPFQLRFVANGAKNARGFYLAYRQNPCRN